MKRIGFAFILITITSGAFSQPLFTYGKKAVTKDEFVTAFNKNPNSSKSRKESLREYLDLYIKFKLKVQAAYDAGLDKDASQQTELTNFRRQIADNIINEQANLKALVKEAFDRSQKEIHLAQVFIEVAENGDTTEAYKKINLAHKQLQEGKDFAAVSQEFSTDEATKQAKGDLGFITVFTLPYDLETIAYSLPVNSVSTPVKTKAGYHIFKNVGERKPLGSRRVAQILIAFPPDATEKEKNAASHKADSIYSLLLTGADFGKIAATTSNDLSSSDNGGELPEFTAGTYSADFEQTAFSLKKPGEISKPFQTSYGWHILKLLEVKPVSTDVNDAAFLASLEEKVTKDDRMEKSKKELMQKKLTLIKYKPAKYDQKSLFAFTDTALLNDHPSTVKGIGVNTVLFSFAKQPIKATDWVNFVKNKKRSDENSKLNYRELFKEFIQASADDYYRKNLEDYNRGVSKQIKEFKEANLLFGIMEKNVWSKANSDTAGLTQYYNLHKSKYMWGPSADVIIVTCKTDKLVEELQRKLKDSVQNWRLITSNYGSDVVADSGRFELGQLAVAERTNFTPALLTVPVKNTNDETYTFNYIVNVYREPAQRSFEDSRGLVTSDYQQVLEDKWIEELKKKYPVKINEEVFRSIK